jgi:phage major head subunit gpT-like protein
MASPLVSSQFTRLLDARLREVGEGIYNDLPSMIPELYGMMDSQSAWEEFFEVGAVPDIPEFNGRMSTLGVAPGYHTKIEHKEYGGMIEIERKLIDDKKYGVLDNMAGGLMTSAHRVQEKLGVKTFANAFSSAFDFMDREEGEALCSSSHGTKAGTSTSSGFDNAGTTALSKTSIAATRILMRQFRNDISERVEVSDNLALIVPDNLADTAHEIVGTPSGYDTAASDKNMQAGRYKVIPYLRLDDYDTNNWFMVDLDKMKKALVWLSRVKPEIEMTADFQTKMAWISIYFRVSSGFKDWRWIYGHAVT